MKPLTRPWQDRLWDETAPGPEGCLLWTGNRTQRGYGMFYGAPGVEKRPVSPAHRWAYIYRHGAIPAGMEIDHLCNVPACVNPDHLEAVTRAENMRRRSERQTHCKRGHEFTEANTMRSAKGRMCRACFNSLRRGYAAKRRAEGVPAA